MTIHSLARRVSPVLALAFSVQCLTAGEQSPAASSQGRGRSKTVAGESPAASPMDPRDQARLKRAHHLAEKGANTEFLNSPQGIAFKDQLTAIDVEINAVYEKYLNIFREEPDTGKGRQVREERERLLRALSQKQKKAEADYENLKKSSPVYRAMVEKHLKGELRQLKGKLQPRSADDGEDMEDDR